MKAKTNITALHKKCVTLFLKNQDLIYGVSIRNGSNSLALEVSFRRENCPAEFPWIAFYAFQDSEISNRKLAAIEKYLLTGIAEFKGLQ